VRSESDISSSFLEDAGVSPSELSPGADEEGRTRISAIQFFQDWTKRNSREVIAARSQFSLGVGALDATDKRRSA
jgi:hemolysin activation/secretion protein